MGLHGLHALAHCFSLAFSKHSQLLSLVLPGFAVRQPSGQQQQLLIPATWLKIALQVPAPYVQCSILPTDEGKKDCVACIPCPGYPYMWFPATWMHLLDPVPVRCWISAFAFVTNFPSVNFSGIVHKLFSSHLSQKTKLFIRFFGALWCSLVIFTCFYFPNRSA